MYAPEHVQLVLYFETNGFVQCLTCRRGHQVAVKRAVALLGSHISCHFEPGCNELSADATALMLRVYAEVIEVFIRLILVKTAPMKIV
jgi:hypothetical protein